MSRPTTVPVMAVVLIVAGAAVPAVMARSAPAATETPTDAGAGTSTPNATDADSNGSTNESAGERLQGAIGAQEAEVDGEIRTRRFGIRTARAATDDAKAAVVAEELVAVETRLDELEERQGRLRRARDDGTISQGRYRAEMARLAVRTETAASLANRSADIVEDLPADVRDHEGLDVVAIRGISQRARDLAGPSAADRGRTIDGRTERTGNRTVTPGTDGTSAAGHGPESLPDRTV